MSNKNRNVSVLFLILMIFFVLGVFFPFWMQWDPMDLGFGIAFISGFLAIVCVVGFFMFNALAIEEACIKSGSLKLACWEYTQDEWDAFTSIEKISIGQDKFGLFVIIAGWAILFGILFPIFDFENGIYVTYVMLGLMLLMWVVMKISVYRAKNAIKKSSKAYISRFGVYFAGVMFSWRMYQARLLRVDYVSLKKMDLLNFRYRAGRNIGNIRIPIPNDKKDEAKKIVRVLNVKM